MFGNRTITFDAVVKISLDIWPLYNDIGHGLDLYLANGDNGRMKRLLAILAVLVLTVPSFLWAQASGAQLNGTGSNGQVLMRDTTSGAGWSWQSGFQLNTQAGLPTQSASTCGTTPTIVGTNSVGSIVLGAGPTLPCQIVFSQNFTNAPKCVIDLEVLTTGTTTGRATSVLVSGFVVTTSAALVATDKVSWICIGV